MRWDRAPNGTSSKALKKDRAYRLVYECANDCIDGVNSLYGCNGQSIESAHLRSKTPAHESIQKHILRCAFESEPDKHVQKPRAALHELLGQRLDYTGGATTVVPFDEGKVSLPDGLVNPVDLKTVLPADARDILKPERLLADEDVVAFRQSNDPITIYTDEVLKHNKSKRFNFFRMLAQRGLLGLTRRRRGTVSPFFVKKKKGQQRLVLDCRAVNQLFRRPRRPEMGPAESAQRMQTPPQAKHVMKPRRI